MECGHHHQVKERAAHLFLAASMSLIFLPLISFPDSLSMAFLRSLEEANSTTLKTQHTIITI